MDYVRILLGVFFIQNILMIPLNISPLQTFLQVFLQIILQKILTWSWNILHVCLRKYCFGCHRNCQSFFWKFLQKFLQVFTWKTFHEIPSKIDFFQKLFHGFLRKLLQDFFNQMFEYFFQEIPYADFSEILPGSLYEILAMIRP